MKITIDTKEDSHAEIRNIIKMLSSLVEGKEVVSNDGDMFSDDDSTEKPSSMFNMFGESNAAATSEDTKTDDEPEEKKKEESTDVDLGIPELEEYED